MTHTAADGDDPNDYDAYMANMEKVSANQEVKLEKRSMDDEMHDNPEAEGSVPS